VAAAIGTLRLCTASTLSVSSRACVVAVAIGSSRLRTATTLGASSRACAMAVAIDTLCLRAAYTLSTSSRRCDKVANHGWKTFEARLQRRRRAPLPRLTWHTLEMPEESDQFIDNGSVRLATGTLARDGRLAAAELPSNRLQEAQTKVRTWLRFGFVCGEERLGQRHAGRRQDVPIQQGGGGEIPRGGYTANPHEGRGGEHLPGGGHP